MARPQKKNSDPKLSMEQLLHKAVEAFIEPYDDRIERDAVLPSVRSVADQLNTTILRTRKLLITAEYYSTETSRLVQSLTKAGVGTEEIMAATGLKKASINSYLPYKNLAFNLDQTTVNADRHRVFRRRVKALDELRLHSNHPNEMEYLWKAIIAFENYPFKTSGCGSREGVRFKYTVSRAGGSGGRHYDGVSIDGYGNEIWIEGKEKSISRSTVELGYKKARGRGIVKGPKALGLPGSGSYLYPIFLRLGVCKPEL